MAWTRISPGERIYRARRIGTTFGRVYVGAKAHRLIDRHLRPPDMKRRWSRFNRMSAESIYDAAVELRGLILKGCQFLGARADVLPREYVSILSALHDRVPPKPFEAVRETVEHQLGRTLGDVFESFAPYPVAAASLAQVHEARLLDGTRVAVKVQYPEIAAQLRGDLANLRVLFRAVGYIERDFDLIPLIDELGTHIPTELDFVNEGHNAETIAEFFAGRDDVAIPAIHWDLTTHRVLTMEYMDGIKITEVPKLRAAGIDIARVARALIALFSEQILVHGFFHADPHPGNILVQRTKEGAPRLVLLDFGLAKELPALFRERVLAFSFALLKGDPTAMTTALLDLGFETRDGSPDSIFELCRFIVDAARKVQEQSYLDRDLNERLRREVPERIRENPVIRVPSDVVFLARVLGLVSGVNRSLGAKIDLLQAILPHALGDPAAGRRAATPDPA